MILETDDVYLCQSDPLRSGVKQNSRASATHPPATHSFLKAYRHTSIDSKPLGWIFAENAKIPRRSLRAGHLFVYVDYVVMVPGERCGEIQQIHTASAKSGFQQCALC